MRHLRRNERMFMTTRRDILFLPGELGVRYGAGLPANYQTERTPFFSGRSISSLVNLGVFYGVYVLPA
jgi:hypothetical protein